MGNESSKTKSKSKEPKKKEPVEYVNGKGWVDEDGNVVEEETGKVRNRRALELVDNVMEEHEAREQEQARAEREGREVEQPELETEKKGKVGVIEVLCRTWNADEVQKRKHAVVVHQEETKTRSAQTDIYDIPGEGRDQAPATQSSIGKRSNRQNNGLQDQVDAQIEAEQHPAKRIRSEGTQSKPSSSNDLLNAQPARTLRKGNPSTELHTEKPSATFKPRTARPWTVTMALPGSILNNVARHDTKTLLVGRIARAAAVWCVDEIVVYDDDPNTIPEKVSGYYRSKKKTKAEIMDSISEADIPYQNPDRFMVGLLEYADCPPHIRSALFPMCEPYKHVGLLPPLDTPSHTKPHEWIRFREGVALPSPPAHLRSKSGNQEWTYINCGLPFPVKVPYAVPQGMRLTVEFKDAQPPSWPYLSEYECESLAVDAVAPETPREKEGYYWGYKVRYAASFSNIFSESEFPDGYTFAIGTSERGVPLSSILPDAIAPRNRPISHEKKLPDSCEHLLVVFGGVAGLEPVVANDPVLGELSKESAHEAFDYWVNLVQGQGSRTIRTEEAVEIGLAGLKGYVDYQYEAHA
ncbi:uncharacterized protein N0V89_003316 [Didymosphaeria variabile]|uniref:DUF171-domain-containing protein n=1 Tax=Didymosphaeria variabile TaxID=1932322 RepID=A0A9W9CF83_9PLEO|nr:uncharacterized protein N0V89_003316 [Didymosphaeria variabile]KAJ4358732.1 hypothetical protein N0V89_003316 [Didymosphaeria variabile]